MGRLQTPKNTLHQSDVSIIQKNCRMKIPVGNKCPYCKKESLVKVDDDLFCENVKCCLNNGDIN